MYSLVRPILFLLDPEFTHTLSLKSLAVAHSLGCIKPFMRNIKAQPVEVMGLTFPNPVGMAAGLDKNGDYFNALGDMGFGFVEIGTVTPRPQPGNDKPRLFRLAEHRAIINRMGFNNKGVDHLIAQAQRRKFGGILGINIGKNATTPLEQAIDDYRTAMAKAYPLADYITVNISSPNTPGLRTLQYGEQFQELLSGLKTYQAQLQLRFQRYVPLAIKIAPDLSETEVRSVAQTVLQQGIDAVIATNTTLSRDAVSGHPLGKESGGLSGAPLTDLSTRIIEQLYAELGERIPIIGVGGIMCGDDAAAKIKAGAKLVQLYSGFIYRGPRLVAEAADAIASLNRSAVGA